MNSLSDIEFFTRECSSKTVQANESGFFNSYYQSVVEGFNSESDYKNWLKNDFAKQGSDFDKLHFLYLDDTVSWPILGALEHVKPVSYENFMYLT